MKLSYEFNKVCFPTNLSDSVRTSGETYSFNGFATTGRRTTNLINRNVRLIRVCLNRIFRVFPNEAVEVRDNVIEKCRLKPRYIIPK